MILFTIKGNNSKSTLTYIIFPRQSVLFSNLSMTVEYHLSITDHISWDSRLFQLPLKHKVLPKFQKGLEKDHNSYIGLDKQNF